MSDPRALLAPVPPRGWNSWNAFHCHGLTEQRVRQAAAIMVDTGLADAGYTYVAVDDCWQHPQRAADGALQPHPKRFAAGIDALAEHVHGLGLKFGLYACPGSKTCAMTYDDYPGTALGSLGHERQDARTFAGWGVDYLKYDWCLADRIDHLSQPDAVQRIRRELDATGRDIVLSIHCPTNQGPVQPWEWASQFADLWRTTGDIRPAWGSVCEIVDAQAGLATYSRVGRWNDPDMLEVGNGELGDDAGMAAVGRCRAHLAMWAILNAPLMIGTDLSSLPSWLLPLLTDADMLAVQADFAGSQGRRVRQDGPVDVWAKPMSTGELAVVVLNRDIEPATVRCDDETFAPLQSVAGLQVPSVAATEVSVPGQDAVLLRLPGR